MSFFLVAQIFALKDNFLPYQAKNSCRYFLVQVIGKCFFTNMPIIQCNMWILHLAKKLKKWHLGNCFQFSSVAQSCPTFCDSVNARLPCTSPTPGACSNLGPSSQ